MKVAIECGNCGKQVKADVAGVITTLIECFERDSIYGGFLCEDCASDMDDENN